jgi:hypothetical protein
MLAERREIIVVEMCSSAADACMPVMCIFPRKHMSRNFSSDYPLVPLLKCTNMGESKTNNVSLFPKFIALSALSKKPPVLFLFDGHASHTKSHDLL